jgi:hypothetical protein
MTKIGIEPKWWKLYEVSIEMVAGAGFLFSKPKNENWWKAAKKALSSASLCYSSFEMASFQQLPASEFEFYWIFRVLVFTLFWTLFVQLGSMHRISAQKLTYETLSLKIHYASDNRTQIPKMWKMRLQNGMSTFVRHRVSDRLRA